MSFETDAAWDSWLDAHGSTSPGVWLRIAKKDAGERSVTYDEALETALCHGWIDGLKHPHDALSWLQKFTPRGPKSRWSKRNTGKVERLVREGRMKPAGLAAVALAQADGRWDEAYDSPGKAEPPPDFLAALKKNKMALSFFVTLNAANRYAFIYRVQTAKKAETRARKIREFVEMLERQEKFH
jgi:uncharacterized protein YdeI (YjbR/CyaY-like superfamily)